MASARETGRFYPNEKVPVQCLDNPFGFNAEVIYGDESIPLHQCTPFLTIYSIRHTPAIYNNERSDADADADAEETSVIQNDSTQHFMPSNVSNADNLGQPNATSRPVCPEDAEAHYNQNHLTDGGTFTDGGAPLTMATGGMGNYKPQQMESLAQLQEEEWDKHPRTRMKKVGKRGGKKSRQKQRK